MNSDERLLQVLESSACLRKTQLLAYLNKELFPEELRVVETHLAECGLCNEALEGFDRSGDARALIDNLQPPTLPVIEEKEKKGASPAAVGNIKSGIETAKGYVTERSNGLKEKLPVRRKNNSWVGAVGIAALLLIGFGLIWQFELKHKSPAEIIARGNRGLEQEQAGEPMLSEGAQEQQSAEAVSPEEASARTSAQAPTTDSTSGKHRVSDTPTLLAAAPIQKDSLSRLAGVEAKKEVNLTDNEVDEKMLASDKLAAQAASKTIKSAEEQPAKPTVAAAKTSAREDADAKTPAPLTDFETGVDLYKKKQYASALLYLKSAASDASDPRHWDAVYYSALCNKRLDKTGRAKRLFRSIIRAGAPQKSAAEKQLEGMSATAEEE